MVCISSKLYYGKGFDNKIEKVECQELVVYKKPEKEVLIKPIKKDEKKDKMSAKGIQQKHNEDIMNFETYKSVVLENKMYMAQAKGMRIFNDSQIYKEKNDVAQNRKIYNYIGEKIGLTQKYDKRIVLADGVSTVPLNI